MTDRELLKKAAKAAGIEVKAGDNGELSRWQDNEAGIGGWWTAWNPLTDDGDALRLAVKLRLELDHNHPQDNDGWVMALENGKMVGPTEAVEDEAQRLAATRRAIVRAAAAMAPQER